MTDTALNYYVMSGTTVQRTAHVPNPGVAAAGPTLTPLWWDTTLTQMFAWIGGAWVGPIGGATPGPRQGSVTKPLAASFTSFNFAGTTTGVDGVTGIMLQDTVASAANFRFMELTAALPAAPWDIYAHFGFLPNGSQAGITIRDSANGRFIMMGKNTNQFIITVWNSPTSFAGNRLLPNVWEDCSWFRFNMNAAGTVITCYASPNGLDWFQMYQETIASFLVGPMDKVGIAIQTDTAPVGLLCDSFSFSAPT